MKAVGYVRISKADRDKTEAEQRLSLRQQADQIRDTCAAKDWELLAIHEDFALSGNDDTRPGFAAVAEEISSGRADVVVVRHVDRLYRKAWRLLKLVDAVKDGGEGWDIYSIEQAFDTREPEGWFAFSQFALYGDFERRLIGKRTRQALGQLRKEGKHTGRRSLIPAGVEDRIAELYSAGQLSASGIARQLEAEGVARPVKDDATGQVRQASTWTYEHVQAALRRYEARILLGTPA